MTNSVFLVHHIHVMPNEVEDVKLIGVYQTNSEALSAVIRAKSLPGFLEVPDGFEISEYEVGKDHWVEGYFTWVPEQDE